jgi:hypothetical protein
MLQPLSSHDSDSSLAELIQFSSQALLRKATQRTESISTVALGQKGWVTLKDSNADFEAAEFEATAFEAGSVATLMPLRDRDLVILTELFKQDQIEEIEANILHNLLQRCTEPCWEDDPMEFLEEFL